MSGSITVLGAGSVGVGTALHLQQRGWQVTLIDRSKPASHTSFGNAGVINNSSFVPLNNQGLWNSLPRYLKNDAPEVRYQWRRVFKEWPWFLHFLKHANAKSTEASATALNELCTRALDEHRAFMQRSGNMHRLSECGWLKVYRGDKGYNSRGIDGSFFERFGVAAQPVSAQEISDLEPDLRPIFKSGYLLKASTQINNPGELIKEYAAQFVADGGTLLQTDIAEVTHDGKRFHLKADTPLEAERLVVAAGPWSADVLKPLGYKVMLGVERGYHQHFHPQSGTRLNRTLQDVDGGYIMAPMEAGIRLTTGVELALRDSPDNYAQLNQVVPRAKEAFPLAGPTKDPIWRGARPTLPDSRPIIGAAPAHDKLWLNFGHQHIGLMTGPISGKLLAQQISGETPDTDLTPFRASRWVKH